MKLTAIIKLLTDPTQTDQLKRTLETANRACNGISRVAWERKEFKQIPLHHIVYTEVRRLFDLSAQVTVRCIAKVIDAYKLSRRSKRVFKKHGAIAYDSRILTIYPEQKVVSIWVIGEGRIKIPFTAGKRQLKLLRAQQGESDLVYRSGSWYLYAACNVEEPTTFTPSGGVLGVDLGTTNIVVTSDGTGVSGGKIEANRAWYASRRATLQSVGTRSAKRRLKQLSGKQTRFQTDTNHRISKVLVSVAKHTKRALAFEDLKGINRNLRTRVRGNTNRAVRSNWSFFQLQTFVGYKARRIGVPVVFVDPAYTSQMCSHCGYTAKANRRSQADFRCVRCGFSTHADLNAAVNIARRGEKVIKGSINTPYGVGPKQSRHKPLRLRRGG